MRNYRRLHYINRLLSPFINQKKRRFSPHVAQSKLAPGFIGIGGHRCGSTWLNENLRSHSDIFIPKEKELHYFDLYFYRSWKYYLSQFSGGENRLKGEITPAYGILEPEMISYIHRHLPETKILFMLRNPIERAWSHALMAVDQFQKKDPREVPESFFRNHFKRPASFNRGDYGTIYKNWEKEFGRDKIWIGFHQDISTEPLKCLTSCFIFLNVPVPTSWENFPTQIVHNKGISYPIPPALEADLKDMYFPLIKKWDDVFGPRVNEWIK